MAENFDLIFGQNAGQQYAWSDNDYQNGWETIGSIPPTAAQFDALQRRADMKSQDLNSRLMAVERYVAGGNKREPNTGYTVGTVLTYDGLPMDWVLECIVGGVSSATDITLPSPRVEGARILDGTVTWALRKITTYGGIGYRQSSTPYHTGNIAFSTSLPVGLYLDCTVAGTTGSGDLVVTRKNVGEIVTDGTVTWTVRKFADTTEATQTTSGLMSASDKVKLDGMADSKADKTYVDKKVSDLVNGAPEQLDTLQELSKALNNDKDYASTVNNALAKKLGKTEKAVSAETADSAADVTDATVSPRISNINGVTIPASGAINNLNSVTGSNELTSTNKLRSYIGSIFNGDWYNVISIRHGNGETDGTIYGLLMYSNLGDNWDTIHYKKQCANDWTEERTLLDSSNYNNYAPTKTGGGASGTWGINISGNAASATNADKVDGIHAASLFYNKGNWDADNWATIGAYQVTGNPPVSNAYSYGQVISSSTDNFRFQLYASHGYAGTGRLHYRTGYGASKEPWNTILDSENYNLFTPTKTGGGASGTWGINISGNADTVDGYHASDLLRILGGNRAPVITDIFDRAGTIDMSTMSAADKAKHKANINKASNVIQNIWNNSTGIHAYSGDMDMNGYSRGALKLTQSYKNFDKIFVVGSNDAGNRVAYKLWNVYELAYAFSHSFRFQFIFEDDVYWNLYGSVRTGTDTDYVLSTDTILNCYDQNCGIIAIYGIKY